MTSVAGSGDFVLYLVGKDIIIYRNDSDGMARQVAIVNSNRIVGHRIMTAVGYLGSNPPAGRDLSKPGIVACLGMTPGAVWAKNRGDALVREYLPQIGYVVPSTVGVYLGGPNGERKASAG